MKTTKATKIIYWVFTGLLSAFILFASIPDILSISEAVAIFKHLGYPVYLLPFLGIAKFLGVVAILIPGYQRIKEWAYAGLFFDLSGALYSGIASGDPASAWAPIFIIFILLAGSYIYYHKKIKAVSLANLRL